MHITCDSCGATTFNTMLDHQAHKYQDDGKTVTWNYALLQCTGCGMGFINPKPTFELLQTFYSADYGCYATTMDLAKEASSIKYKLAKLRYASAFGRSLSNSVATTVGILAEWVSGKVVSYSLGLPLNLSKDSQILEVGYGSGSWLLIMAQLGYTQLHGYDIDANVENKMRLEANGISVHSGNLLEIAYPNDYFDCIRLEHVFEHLLEPDIILAELYRMLKPNGNLVMNFPGINAMSFNLSPLHYANRDSPRHLYLHTLTSARNMLQKANFTVRNMREYGVALILGSTITNTYPIKLKGVSLLAPFYHLINVIAHRGEAITLWATK